MVEATTAHVTWSKTHRLIMSHYPPIDLFDDLADPRDWEALASAEARTSPRIYEQIGDLGLVPADRRIGGEGASWVMSAFTHVSTDRPSRFTDGSYGVYYAGNDLETALREHTFHTARIYGDARMKPGWLSQVRQLVGTIDSALTDIRGSGFDVFLDPDVTKYAAAQSFASAQKFAGSNGIVYPSQRNLGGQCIAAFYPDVVSIPSQADHFRYHWNGAVIDYAQKLSGDRLVYDLID